MSEAIEWLREPDLTDPILLGAFGGWGDASDAATGAVRWLISHWNGRRVARIRPDDFFDFTVARPAVRLDEGGQRSVVWPSIDVFEARPEDGSPHAVLMYGREPHLHWPEFAAAVLEIASQCSVTRGMTLGAFFGPVLHTAPVQLTGYASDAELIRRLTDAGATPSTYEGPTGIASVLHESLRKAGTSSLSLWAAVPFYLGSLRPNPRATHALLDGLSRVLALDIDLGRLRQAADYFDEQIERQVRDNAELRNLIAQVSSRATEPGGTPQTTEHPAEPAGELPSAEAIIKDLEDFLRGGQAGPGAE